MAEALELLSSSVAMYHASEYTWRLIIEQSIDSQVIVLSTITYGDSNDCSRQFKDLLEELITNENLHEICDVGGGANPIVDVDYQNQHGLKYTLLDISQRELDKAPDSYTKVCADITDSTNLPSAQWDLVFSQTLAEHVKDGQAFHTNVFQTLKPGGYAMHIYPSLLAIPFIINKFLPEKIGSFLLDTLLPRDRYQNDKFPAHYSWCFGPTKKMVRRFEEIGYEITNYKGLFGHRYYRFIPFIQKLQNRYADWLIEHPIPQQTSYVILILRKPLN